MTKTRSRWAAWRSASLAASLALAATGIAATPLSAGASPGSARSATDTAGRHRAQSTSAGDVVSFPFITGDAFTWILPLENGTNDEPWNTSVSNGSWIPLYFVGKGTKTGVDYTVSIGKAPVFSAGDTTVTIAMNTGFTWSDGQPVTSTDVKFFFELDEAGKHTLGDYLPGEMPDDVTSVTYPGPDTIVLHLNHAYNPAWFTQNQLTWIYPLPAQAWDKTCATCPVGTPAATTSGAKAVFHFLAKQSSDLHTYATNPLWKTVDGPWVIREYDPVTHEATFVANAHYTGPTRPRLAGYRIYSFTTDTAEVNALRAGTLTLGYLPLASVSEASYFKKHGFVVEPWKLFYNEAMEFGYTSKTWGALMKQLYVRQALQHLVTEHLYITRTLHGYGLPDYGPIADYPGSSFVSPALRTDPYPYSVRAATHLLAAHGWKSGPGGTDVCERPGTAATDCGAGIPKGKALSFPFIYSSGTTAFTAQVSAFATAAKKAGFDITVDGQSLNTMLSIVGVCPKTPPCKYGLAGYAGYMWDYGQYTGLPTGDNQFGKGNYWAGGYYTPKAQQLIDAADDASGGLTNLYAADDYLSKDVASLWWPLPDEIVVVSKRLKGLSLSPYGTFVPQDWSLSG